MFTNITIYSDASFCHQTKVAGFAIWARNKDKWLLKSTTTCDVVSTNDAEIMSICWGVHICSKYFPWEDVRLVITCDSLVALEFLSGRRDNHRVSDRSHKAKEWLLRAVGVNQTIFSHVKGHVKRGGKRSYVNNLVDVESRRVMRLRRDLVLNKREET